MAEPTTTPAVDDTGASAQPVDPTPAEAVEEPTTTTPEAPEEPKEEQPKEEAPSEPVDDDKLAKWAESKGLTLDSENAKKAAQMAREAEKAMHSKAQKASELEKAAAITQEQLPEDATPQEQENVRLRNLELRLSVSDWKQRNPDKLGYEEAMVSELSDPVKRELVQAGYLGLDDLYRMARGGDTSDVEAAKSQAKRETLESLAQKQQAAVPTGDATTSGAPKPKAFAEKSIAEMEAELGFAKQ